MCVRACMYVFVCVTETHRLAAGNPVWRLHGACKTAKALEKTRLFRRDWEHRPILGIIVACSLQTTSPLSAESWELTVCRRVRVRTQGEGGGWKSSDLQWQWKVTVNRKFLLACRRACVTAAAAASSDLDPSALFTQSCWWTAGLQGNSAERAEIPPVLHFNHA